MSVSVGLDQVSLRGGARRLELVECLPALRESLEHERAIRVEQLSRLTAGTCVDVNGQHGLRAPRGFAGDVDAALDRARGAFADIERALTAIRIGTYGSCEECADEIPFAVLRAVPQARRCLRCHRNRGGAPWGLTADRRGTADRGGHAAASALPAPPSSRTVHRVRTSAPNPGGSGERDGSVPARSVVWVRWLLGRPLLGPDQQHLGHVRDVVARQLPDGVGTVVTGLIADAGGHRWFAPAATVRELQTRSVLLKRFSIRPADSWLSGEHLLAQDWLGCPVMTSPGGQPPPIADIALRPTPAGWTVWAADTRTTVQRLLGSPRRIVEWEVLTARRFATLARSPDDT